MSSITVRAVGRSAKARRSLDIIHEYLCGAEPCRARLLVGCRRVLVIKV